MTLAYFLENFDKIDLSQREKFIRPVAKHLCIVSRATLADFQATWDGDKSFEDFVKAQNQVIRKCIEIEISFLGQAVRKTLNLEPFPEEFPDEEKKE